jgi:putative membrane protein insertion efficiency factor
VHQQLICRPAQVTRIILALIAIYKSILSPLFGPRCRFHPSCSDYARVAVSRFGAGRGGLLALWRIARCQPLCAGGIEPVPDKFALPPCRHKEFPA